MSVSMVKAMLICCVCLYFQIKEMQYRRRPLQNGWTNIYSR